MIDEQNYLRWMAGPQAADEVLRDFEAMAAQTAPNQEYGAYWRTKKYRHDAVERNGASFLADDPKFPKASEIYHLQYSTPLGPFGIITSPVKPAFICASIRGLMYLADHSQSGIRLDMPDGKPKYWYAMQFNLERMGNTSDVYTRLGKIIWGQQAAVVSATDALTAAIGYRGMNVETDFLTGPSPFYAPIKDMSAFDAQLENIFGKAQARHALREII